MFGSSLEMEALDNAARCVLYGLGLAVAWKN